MNTQSAKCCNACIKFNNEQIIIYNLLTTKIKNIIRVLAIVYAFSNIFYTHIHHIQAHLDPGKLCASIIRIYCMISTQFLENYVHHPLLSSR